MSNPAEGIQDERELMSYDSRVDTRLHIKTVQHFLGMVTSDLLLRARNHDTSKLQSPEVEVFDRVTPRLKTLTYLSDEYNESLADMGEALKHHYAANDHHPEHFPGGIQDMSLPQIMEMLCDWKAATLRHADGDIRVSIEKNQKRFGYSDELKQILLNTLPLLEKEPAPSPIAPPTSICAYTAAAFTKCTEGLTPEQIHEVVLWWTGQLPTGFWETVSREAHSAILELCSLGLG